MQDCLLRTQQLLVQQIERLENLVCGAHFPRQHRLYNRNIDKYEQGTPKTLTVASFPNVHVSTLTPSSTVNVPHSVLDQSSPSISSKFTSTPQLSTVPNTPPPNSTLCPRLVHKQESRCLSSPLIRTQKLVPLAEAIGKYPKLLVVGKAPTLAMKLALKAFFEEDLMDKCTVMG